MNLEEQNILLFSRAMGLGGTEKVILQLSEILKPLVNKVIVCSCGGSNVEVLRKMEIKHYEIPDIERKSIKTIVSVSKRLLSIIKKENITVIHTHHRMAAFYVVLLGLDRKCIFLNTCHNTFVNKQLLTRIAYRKANLVACGEMVKKNLIEYFNLHESQITVIHNAVKPFDELVVIDPIIEKLRNENCFIVANIGRLSEQKGMEYYIQAVPAVIKEHPNMRFLIIGSGEDEQKLKNLVKSLKIVDYVFFMGYRTDVQNLMLQADLIVLSSLWEGLPLTPIEAFSVGKTIVATAVDGTVEIVDDGVTGMLISPRSSPQIAEKIIWSMEHPEKIKRMQQSAYQVYTEKFSFELFAEKYINYYKSLE